MYIQLIMFNWEICSSAYSFYELRSCQMRKTEPDNRDMTFSKLASKMKTKIRGVSVNTFQGEYPLTNSSPVSISSRLCL